MLRLPQLAGAVAFATVLAAIAYAWAPGTAWPLLTATLVWIPAVVAGILGAVVLASPETESDESSATASDHHDREVDVRPNATASREAVSEEDADTDGDRVDTDGDRPETETTVDPSSASEGSTAESEAVDADVDDADTGPVSQNETQ